MGLLEQIAAAAIRNRMVAALRERCPEPLREPLEQLLADKDAVAAIQQLATAAHAGKVEVTPDALMGLPLSGATTTLLQENPRLVKFLVMAAASLQKR